MNFLDSDKEIIEDGLFTFYNILVIPVQETYAIGKAQQVICGALDFVKGGEDITFEVSQESFDIIVKAFENKPKVLSYVLSDEGSKITVNEHLIITPCDNSEGTLVDIKPSTPEHPTINQDDYNVDVLGELKQLLIDSNIHNMPHEVLTELETHLCGIGQAVRNLTESKRCQSADLENLNHCLSGPAQRGRTGAFHASRFGEENLARRRESHRDRDTRGRYDSRRGN